MIAGLSRAEAWARLAIPACLVCLLVGLQAMPWPGSPGPAMPCLALMGIVYLSARLPETCPPLFALCIGCCADLLELTPLGAQGLFFLAVTLIIRSRSRRMAERAFISLWGIFSLLALVEMAWLWLLEAVLAETVLPTGQLVLRAMVSILAFPLVIRFLVIPAERLVRDTRHG
jgi:rod shape-determining protein MreD